MIEIIGLTKKFGDNVVIDNVTLKIPEKQKISVIGPSGCGKSTLLRMVIALTKRGETGEILGRFSVDPTFKLYRTGEIQSYSG